MEAIDSVKFYGHPLIRATHHTTFEITKDESITQRGTCIIGVRANKACRDLNEEIKSFIRSHNAIVHIELIVDDEIFKTSASGDPFLTLEDERDIVVRKSNYVCKRTLAVKCRAAAKDIPRSMIDKLKDPSKEGLMIIKVEV
ncbi:MAG: DUF371 domain-containing protein [Nitrososphaerota archaeon]|nr:DUF371 domain-containing protein [Nitrososphaerales archaeon]MDW8044515.1 DUF371 domain-containing protein [Nitrososphaerota archaeon]